MTSSSIDLSGLPVVDQHCHAVERTQGHTDVAAWHALFSESHDAGMRARDAADTAFYRRLLAAMADFHGVDTGHEQDVLDARARLSTLELVSVLFRDVGVGGVVVDTGFPAGDLALPGGELSAASGAQQVTLLRLELLFQDLVATTGSYDELVEAVRDTLVDVRGRGHAGFKTIAGYRTGLDITRWNEPDVRASYVQARAEATDHGSVRLGHKPLLDTLLHLAFEAAAAQALPVQFHVGYGDPDVDLRTATPLALREVLEQPAYRPMQVVLLHGCWPYFREGAYLAAVYPNAHLDLSYAIPFLSVAEMRSVTRAALGAAPYSKLLYSSDGARVPELHWLGAREGRRVLGDCLAELVADGDLPAREVDDVATRVLAGNARAMYGMA